MKIKLLKKDILDYEAPSEKSTKYYRRSDRYFRYAMYTLLVVIALFRFIFPEIKTPIPSAIINAIILITYIVVTICSVLTIIFGVQSFIHKEKGPLNRVMILLISLSLFLVCIIAPIYYFTDNFLF